MITFPSCECSNNNSSKFGILDIGDHSPFMVEFQTLVDSLTSPYSSITIIIITLSHSSFSLSNDTGPFYPSGIYPKMTTCEVPLI